MKKGKEGGNEITKKREVQDSSVCEMMRRVSTLSQKGTEGREIKGSDIYEGAFKEGR